MWDEIVKWRVILLVGVGSAYRNTIYSHAELKGSRKTLIHSTTDCFCAAVGAGEDCSRQRRVFPESELVYGQGPVVGKAS